MRVNPGADAGVACVAQWTRVADVVAGVPDSEFSWPSGLPGWRVSELVAHLVMCAASPARWLMEPAPLRPEVNAADYLLCLTAAAPSIDERTRELAAGRTPAQLRAQVREAVDSLRLVVAETDPARVIPTRLAPMRFDDFLVTRCVEGVVHHLDLSPFGSVRLPLDGGALRIATRALLAALVAKAPGHTVEVRVPPIAAVQCVEGPRHTRGTPSNVVELDPLTWVLVAAGRLPWVAGGRGWPSARERRTQQHQRAAADPLARPTGTVKRIGSIGVVSTLVSSDHGNDVAIGRWRDRSAATTGRTRGSVDAGGRTAGRTGVRRADQPTRTS